MLNCNNKIPSLDARYHLECAARRAGEHAGRLSEWLARVRRVGILGQDIGTLELLAGELDVWAEQLAILVNSVATGGIPREW